MHVCVLLTFVQLPPPSLPALEAYLRDTMKKNMDRACIVTNMEIGQGEFGSVFDGTQALTFFVFMYHPEKELQATAGLNSHSRHLPQPHHWQGNQSGNQAAQAWYVG